MSQEVCVTPGRLAIRHYLPHVDGLRAVAILPVLLYHFTPRLCPGGFTGVDVFFVISGYLITGGIIRDLKENHFSMADFYVRRIKRILPAYGAIIAFVLVYFGFALPLNAFQSIARTAFYSVLYLTNIYFYHFNNYFDLDTRQNPLLHLWSLGVEEQFYLLVPVLILLLWTVKKQWLVYNLSILFVASFVSAVFSLRLGNPNFAFYMLPCRAWEFLAGSLLSQLPSSPATSMHKQRYQFPMSLAGMGLIAAPYAFMSERVPFPGFSALPSVLGTALLLFYGVSGSIGALLSLSPIVWVGQISYSLYLWHWPINVICNLPNVTHWRHQLVVRSALSFAAAFLSWRYIELPIRQLRRFTALHAFAMLILGTLLIGSVCFQIGRTEVRTGNLAMTWRGLDTWATREVARDARRSSCSLNELLSGDKSFILPMGTNAMPPTFVLWGDSHALALLPGLDAAATEAKRAGLFVNLKQNFTLRREIGAYPFHPHEDREPVLRWLESQSGLSDVYLVNWWTIQIESDADVEEVVHVCERLHKAGKRVYFFSDVPLANRQALWRSSWGLSITPMTARTEVAAYDQVEFHQAALIKNLQKAGLATVIPMDKAFLDKDAYYSATASQSYYIDGDHLSQNGALKAARFVAPIIWQDIHTR